MRHPSLPSRTPNGKLTEWEIFVRREDEQAETALGRMNDKVNTSARGCIFPRSLAGVNHTKLLLTTNDDDSGAKRP